jgi:hypothetical protein
LFKIILAWAVGIPVRISEMSKKDSLLFGFIGISCKIAINYKPKIPIKIKCSSYAFYVKKPLKQQSSSVSEA